MGEFRHDGFCRLHEGCEAVRARLAKESGQAAEVRVEQFRHAGNLSKAERNERPRYALHRMRQFGIEIGARGDHPAFIEKNGGIVARSVEFDFHDAISLRQGRCRHAVDLGQVAERQWVLQAARLTCLQEPAARETAKQAFRRDGLPRQRLHGEHSRFEGHEAGTESFERERRGRLSGFEGRHRSMKRKGRQGDGDAGVADQGQAVASFRNKQWNAMLQQHVPARAGLAACIPDLTLSQQSKNERSIDCEVGRTDGADGPHVRCQARIEAGEEMRGNLGPCARVTGQKGVEADDHAGPDNFRSLERSHGMGASADRRQRDALGIAKQVFAGARA